MELKHVAFQINSSDEIKGFYQGLLGMEIIRGFELDKEKALKVFGVQNGTKAVLLGKGDIRFEVFVDKGQKAPSFNHICFSVPDRENLVKEAMSRNFEVKRFKRSKFDLIFIKDNSGNIFEIKQL